MEVVKNQKAIFFVALFLLIVIFFHVHFKEVGDVEASEQIGANLFIELEHKDQPKNSFNGQKVFIKSQKNTKEIFIAFETDKEWLIAAENIKENEIPYISVRDLNIKNSELYSIPVQQADNTFITTITVRSNGSLHVKCVNNDNTIDELPPLGYDIKTIDWVAPNVLRDTIGFWVENIQGAEKKGHFSISINDTFIGLIYPTATSGILRGEVLRTTPELTQYIVENSTPEDNDKIDIEKIKEEVDYETIVIFGEKRDNDTIEAVFVKTGYYYLFLEDKVGNSALYLLGQYTQMAPEGYNIKKGEQTLNIYEYIAQAEEYIGFYKDKNDFNQNRVTELKKELDNLYYTFSTSTENDARLLAYDSFMMQKHIFEKAIEGPMIIFEIKGEENFIGEVICTNLSKDLVTMIDGDILKLKIIISKIQNILEIQKDILDMKKGGQKQCIKLEYTLYKNDEPVVPSKPLKFQFNHKEKINNLEIIATIDGLNATELVVEQQTSQSFIISSLRSNREILIFFDSYKEVKRDLTLIWILLGVYISISVFLIGTMILLAKKQRK